MIKKLAIFIITLNIVTTACSKDLYDSIRDDSARSMKIFIDPNDILLLDGSTFMIPRYFNFYFRFFGVNLPYQNETCISKKSSKKISCGELSKNFLESLLSKAKYAELEIASKRDLNSRYVSILSLDGKDINKLMVENGYAIADYVKCYIKYEKIAQKKNLGIWQYKSEFLFNNEWLDHKHKKNKITFNLHPKDEIC